MSTTIDQRVVEMQFDNRQFEKNVSNTMSTLDKLKEKLNFTGATKGLEDVNTATKNVNMAGLGNAVEAVSMKFSALQVMGVTALANITNSAVNAGKKIIKSLTIDPVRTGFDEYETKMGSIQTILANTEHQGTTLDDVIAALDDLNTYADKTIYNFQQMTKNIGTFTAAGVDLDTSVRSIKGIANLAAVSGSTSQQASTAMYQLSQALAAGRVSLMDWNSVVNAGMGGKVFQNALIRTSEAMDTGAKKAIKKYGSFRESLTKGEWLTTDVLTETLKQFTMAAEEGTEEWNKFKSSLMSQGYTASQADEILKMANTATDAATKVKTFTQLMDTLKESAQSGWAQTWELILGDFEEAKEFFTNLSDIFGGIIGESAERRNNWLGETMNSNWDKLISKINDAGVETSRFEESIRKIVGNDTLDAVIEDYGSLEKAVKQGAISSDILKEALDGVLGSGAGFLAGLNEIEHVLRRGAIGDEVKKLQTALDELGYDLGEKGIDGRLGPATQKAIKAFQEANGLVVDGIAGPKTLAALKNVGEEMESIAGETDELKNSCGSLIDVITNKSGRELMFDSILNIIKAIQRPLQAVGEALRETFAISPKRLYSGLEKINKFTKKLVPKGILDVDTWDGLIRKVNKVGIETSDFTKKLTDVLKEHGIDVDELISKYGDLGAAFEDGAISFDYIKEAFKNFDGISESLAIGGEAVEKIRRTFEGLFAIVDIIATVLTGPLKFAFKIVTEVLKNFGIGVLDLTARIGDAIVRFRDNIDKVVGAITQFISGSVTEWIKKFQESEMLKTVSGWFEEASSTISESIDNISEKISNFSASSFVEKLRSVKDFFSGIGGALKGSEVFGFIADSVVNAFNRVKSFFSGFKLPEFNLDNIKFFTNILEKFDGVKDGKSLFGAAGAWVKNDATTRMKTAFKNLFSMDWATFKTTALEKFANFWITTSDKIGAAFDKCKEVLAKIVEFVFGGRKVDLPTILDLVQKFLALAVLFKALKVLNTFVSPLDNITGAIDNFTKSLKWEAVGAAFKSIAIALGTLTVCIIILASMPDMGKAREAAYMLGGMLVAMGVVVAGLMFMATKMPKDDVIDIVGVAGSLLMLVGTVWLLTEVLQKIDELNLKNPGQTFLTMALMIAGLSAGIKIIAAAGSSSFKSVAAILTLVSALNLILGVITAYSEYDWTGKSKGIWHMVDMLAILSIAINIASRGIRADAGAKGLAMLLLTMVVSLKLLVGIIEDFAAMDAATLLKGGGIVALIFAIMSRSMIAIGNANKPAVFEKGQKAVSNFAGLATALLAMVAAVWLFGKMDSNTLIQGGIAVAAALTILTLMMTNIGKTCGGLKMPSIVAILLSMGILIAEMAIILKTMEDVPWQTSIGSATAMAILMLTMSHLLKSMNMKGVKVRTLVKWIGAMTALSGMMLILAEVLKQVKDVNPTNSIGNVAALGALMTMMSMVLIALTKHRNGAKTIYKWIGALATMSAMLFILAGVLRAIDGINPISSIGNVLALSLLMEAMSKVLISLTKHQNGAKAIYKWIGALATMSAMMYLLAGILLLVKDINPINSIGNVVALSILMAAISGALAAIKTIKFKKSDFDGIVGFAAIATSLLIVVEVLRGMNGVENAIENAIALSILAGALSLCLIPLTFAGKMSTTGAFTGVMSLSILMIALNQLVGVLSSMDGLKNAYENAGVLALLALALSVCLIPLAAVGAIAGAGAIAGVVALAGLMTSLRIIVWVLSSMEGLNDAKENATILSHMLLTMTACLVPLSLIGILVYPALIAVGSLVALMLSLKTIVSTLKKMEGLSNAQSNSEILNKLLTTMTDTITQVSAVSGSVIVGMASLGMLINFIKNLGKAVTTIGWLNEHIPSLETFIDSGLELFKKVARGLGEMISELGAGLTSGLPEMATNLSNFATNLIPFIDTMGLVKDDIVGRTKNLASAVASLAKSDIMRSLGDMLGGSLPQLGTDLSKFAENIDGFVTAMTGVKPETVTGVNTLCTALKALTDANLANAWTQLLPGDQSLSTFGTSIEEFAGCIKDAAVTLAGITDEDAKNIERSATAGTALADLATAIPSNDGLLQNIVGEKDLATFGASVVAFGDCLLRYSAKVSGKNIDAEAITASAQAATSISDLANAIPKEGGVWQDLAGSQDLATFGASIVAFGDCLVNYSAKVSGKTIDAEAIKTSAGAAEALAALSGKLPTQNGLYQAIMGEQDLGSFGTKLVSFAEGIVAYANAAVQIDETKITAITNSGKAVDELVTVVGKVPTEGGWGEAVFGSRDGGSFGDALSSMATGILKYCNVALQITQEKLDAITASGTAIDNLAGVMEKVPETSYSEKTASLAAAVGDLASIGSIINGITTAAYDYSGIDSLKTVISKIAGIISGENSVNTAAVRVGFIDLTGAVSSAVSCAEKLMGINGYSYTGIDDFKKALKSLAESDVDGVIATFSGKAPIIAASINALINSMTTAISDGTDDVTRAMTGILDDGISGIDTKRSAFKTAGEDLVAKLAEGIVGKKPQVRASGSIVGGEAASGASDKTSSMKSAGGDLGSGLVSGINSKSSEVYWAGYALGAMAVKGEKDGQASNSPSKLTIQAGKWLGDGLVIGIRKMGDKVYNAGYRLGDAAIQAVSSTVSKIATAIDSDMDVQPTIRPVLDLSDVRSGAGAISGMLGVGSSVGVLANVNSISRSMNARGQNVSNADVVSAIDRLDKHLDNVGNTTYTIGGITYDDSSNIATAVRDLTRYARMERRI